MSLSVPNLHVSQEHRAIILSIIRDLCPEHSVWAYGSRVAYDDQDTDIFAGTDLDLVVLGKSPLIYELKQAFAECNVPYPIDVVAMDYIPESFKNEIQKKYYIMYNSKQR